MRHDPTGIEFERLSLDADNERGLEWTGRLGIGSPIPRDWSPGDFVVFAGQREIITAEEERSSALHCWT
jgi:hypothetical protein